MTNAPPYRHVAWVYDALASAYSLGAIDRAKAFHHRLVKPGDRVLYAGAGRGREIVGTCQRGAEVTCVEPCTAMAAKLKQRTGRDQHPIAIDPRPIQSVPLRDRYDVVVAHFFLNVFDSKTMPGVLDHLCGFVEPGGRLVLADFMPDTPRANPLAKAMRAAYYRPVNVVGRLLRICALHPIYDYAPLLIERGFSIELRPTFNLAPGLPACYETLVAQRKK